MEFVCILYLLIKRSSKREKRAEVEVRKSCENFLRLHKVLLIIVSLTIPEEESFLINWANSVVLVILSQKLNWELSPHVRPIQKKDRRIRYII